MDLNLRAKQDCLFDEISLGEVMLRLDLATGASKPRAPSALGRAAENTTSRAACGAASACTRRWSRRWPITRSAA